MDFLKKHYEKVVLGVVLLGLVVSAGFLPLMISGERESLRSKADEIIRRPVKELPPLDLTNATALLHRIQTPVRLDLSTKHKLFNPTPWQKKADDALIKVEKGNIGVEAITVSQITPLYLTITLDEVKVEDSGTRYYIGVEREAAATVSQRRKKTYSAVPNNKNDVFIIREVRGAVDNPSELVLELTDSNEMAVLKRDTAYQRVDAYTADFRYAPENKTWLGVRVGVPTRPAIIIAGEEYNVVAITKDEVVFSAKSNNKKTSIPYNPGPQ